MERLFIALAALFGGIVAAALGWLESKEAFDLRKFGGSIVRSLIAGVVLALGSSLAGPIDVAALFYAFLGGAGVDVIGNRLSGNFGNGSFPLAREAPEDPEES
ncbi:hypothetical protein DEALK_18340 [Dehalogenimonas alkenigignens]|uniref:Uncharacterized protein n=1 Tax=Dehalogenimonas alkenigignens TaxID=1217799 RepID=A0A0W0GK94_9CHLR|nr:hypothetical protein [Dehalogenimonas alkenigignens]KTB48987.1 hypothetical protein DEALK_18340 [Dehalogenimonas alkenigignens]